MSPEWAELRAAIAREQEQARRIAALEAEVRSLRQQLRDAQGR
jgi:hypothetical protein